METYYELTIKHSDGTEETILGHRGFSVDVEYELEGGYDSLGIWSSVCVNPTYPVYKIMYYKGNTRYEVTHKGEIIRRGFKADIWWVDFKAGDKWEKASGYHDKLEGALRALDDLEKSTEGFVYRINGGVLGEKQPV